MNSPCMVDATALNRFGVTVLEANGVESEQALAVIDNLVWSELVGRKNFGFIRFPLYLDRLKAGGLNGQCTPRLEKKSESLALLDGDQGFGQFVGRIAMTQAVSMARDSGIGIVGVHNSNFFGTGAYFANQSCEAGMIGLAASNSFPKVVAHGGRTPVFGTNPFAFGAPQRSGDHILVDLSTSALAGSTVREHIDAGTALPEGLAIDGDGHTITDPHKVQDGALLPFGGSKGYCLSFMVEILCGVLTGAGVSSGVSSMYNELAESGQNGHFILALDPEKFMDRNTYFDRIDSLISMVLMSAAPGAPVRIPGQVRLEAYRENVTNGIHLDSKTCQALQRVAKPVDVTVPWT